MVYEYQIKNFNSDIFEQEKLQTITIDNYDISKQKICDSCSQRHLLIVILVSNDICG